MEVLQPRLVEALALLPMLHLPVKQGTKVLVLGPYAELMGAEVHRWPDVSDIIMLMPPKAVSGKKYKVVASTEIPNVDAILLSPEQCPGDWVKHLLPSGVLQATTTVPEVWQRMSTLVRAAMGNAAPWREHLPTPLYGILAHAGIQKLRRFRAPPKTARRLNENYIPCLFTFGKDEIPMAFKQPAGTIPPAATR
jgi:hypothetical protein